MRTTGRAGKNEPVDTTRPEYQVRFSWSEGAIAMWDNRAVHHCAVRDYGSGW